MTERVGGSTRGAPRLTAPLVDREAELAVLDTVYARTAEEGRSHVVTVYGDAGVGKSRLVGEFLERLQDRSPAPLVLRGRCLPYGDGVTYWPLAEMLKAYTGIKDTDSTAEALARIHEVVARLQDSAEVGDGAARHTAALLAYTIGVPDLGAPAARTDPREIRRQLHRAWRSFFDSLAASGPLVVLVEDIHWANPALLDLLDELGERTQRPVLFIYPSRPDLVATRSDWGGGRRNSVAVSLDPLALDEAEHLMRLLLIVDDLPVSVNERILERAEGNPFFLEESLRRLEERELVSPRVGSAFAGQPEYIFKHVLTRDVAYDGIPRRDRGAAHAQVARWLEATAGERSREFGELLAHHYATAVSLAGQAGAEPDPSLRAAAIRWSLRASDDALCKYALGKAERLAHDALALAQGDIERCDALTALGEAYMADMRGDLAWQHYSNAAAVADASAEISDIRTAHLIGRACDLPLRWPGTMSVAVPEAEVRALRDRGLELAGPGDSRERANLLAISASWPFAFPDDVPRPVEEYVGLGLEAAEVALRLGDADLASACYDSAAATYSARGDYRSSMEIWRRRWELRDRLTDDLELVDLYAMGAWESWEISEYESAIRYADAIDSQVLTRAGCTPRRGGWRRCSGSAAGTKPWRPSRCCATAWRRGGTTRRTPSRTCTAPPRSCARCAVSGARPTTSRPSWPGCRRMAAASTAGGYRWRSSAASSTTPSGCFRARRRRGRSTPRSCGRSAATRSLHSGSGSGPRRWRPEPASTPQRAVLRRCSRWPIGWQAPRRSRRAPQKTRSSR